MMGRPLKGAGLDPDAVLDVAADVFATRGYVDTTLDEVARRLGVTRQAILHHFAGKQALFQSVLDRERRWAERSAFSTADSSDPASTFEPLGRFLGLTPESRQRVRLQHVLQGEAVAGDPVAQDFVAARTRVIHEQIHGRVAAVAARNLLSRSWTIDSATTAFVALINGLQTLALIDSAIDIREAFDRFVAALIEEDAS
jgi:AcrR family transcriptional regulator